MADKEQWDDIELVKKGNSFFIDTDMEGISEKSDVEDTEEFNDSDLEYIYWENLEESNKARPEYKKLDINKAYGLTVKRELVTSNFDNLHNCVKVFDRYDLFVNPNLNNIVRQFSEPKGLDITFASPLEVIDFIEEYNVCLRVGLIDDLDYFNAALEVLRPRDYKLKYHYTPRCETLKLSEDFNLISFSDEEGNELDWNVRGRCTDINGFMRHAKICINVIEVPFFSYEEFIHFIDDHFDVLRFRFANGSNGLTRLCEWADILKIQNTILEKSKAQIEREHAREESARAIERAAKEIDELSVYTSNNFSNSGMVDRAGKKDWL